MDVKTLKDFEKEVRNKINHEFETMRKTNDNLSRILTSGVPIDARVPRILLLSVYGLV